MALTKENIKFCFNNLKKLRETNGNMYHIALHLGYLEAALQSVDALDTTPIDNCNTVTRKIIKSKKWWKSDREETHEQAIVRMVQKYLEE